MPALRLTMRKVKELLRLRLRYGLRLSIRQIARSCSLPHSSIINYLQRARVAGLGWPLPDELDDAALEARLFPSVSNTPARGAPLPDFRRIHEELRRHRHLTLSLLWQEYKESHPGGFQYSYRACLGLIRLARRYPAERVEAACTRALAGWLDLQPWPTRSSNAS